MTVANWCRCHRLPSIHNKLPDKTTKSRTARQRRPVSRLRRESFLSWHPTPPPGPCVYEWNLLYTLWPSYESTFFQPHTVLFDRWMNIAQKIEDLVYGTSSIVFCFFVVFFFFGKKTVLLPLYLCIRIFSSSPPPRLIGVVWIFLNKINNRRIEWNARVPVLYWKYTHHWIFWGVFFFSTEEQGKMIIKMQFTFPTRSAREYVCFLHSHWDNCCIKELTFWQIYHDDF